MTASRSTIVVAGPAEAETVRVFRAVGASIASRLGMTLEAIDEYKIVVDEATTMLLKSPGASRLELSIESSGGEILTTLTSDGSADGWPDERTSAWSWHVIRQLARDPAYVTGNGHPRVSFAMGTTVR
jgi:hypothetical protein